MAPHCRDLGRNSAEVPASFHPEIRLVHGVVSALWCSMSYRSSDGQHSASRNSVPKSTAKAFARLDLVVNCGKTTEYRKDIDGTSAQAIVELGVSIDCRTSEAVGQGIASGADGRSWPFA